MTTLYHGTTHYFKKFNKKHFRDISHVGAGVYLSDKQDDAVKNYSKDGPDVQQKLWDMVEDKEENKYLLGDKSYLLYCELKNELNLAVLGNKYYELYSYDEESDECNYTQLGLAITNSGFCYDIEPEMSLKDVHLMIRRNDKAWNDTNPGTVFRDILIEAGFDGVVYEDVYDYFPFMVKKGTKHYVIFEPKNVLIKKRKKLGDFSQIKKDFIISKR